MKSERDNMGQREPATADSEQLELGAFHPEPLPAELEAAKSIYSASGRLRRKVLEGLAQAGERGLTDEEGAVLTGIYRYTYAPRRVELVKASLVERTNNRRRSRPGAVRATVWTITPAGRAALTAG